MTIFIEENSDFTLFKSLKYQKMIFFNETTSRVCDGMDRIVIKASKKLTGVCPSSFMASSINSFDGRICRILSKNKLTI